ncbi:hypothetical protein Taro_012966, partial [Colocasia esculenta]|nr:hypothetical protein [Colocasia esculenta]
LIRRPDSGGFPPYGPEKGKKQRNRETSQPRTTTTVPAAMALLIRQPPSASTPTDTASHGCHRDARRCPSCLALPPLLPRRWPAGWGRRSGSNRSSAIVMATLAAEEGQLERPRWAGETPLSRLVGALISFKPLYFLMKMAARELIISTAEKSNVPWRAMANEILESDVYKEMERIQNTSLVYPDYYLKPFHAYEEGNLSWLAAAEAEAATMAIAKRAVPDASIDEANRIVRGKWLHAIEQHIQQYSGNHAINDILDIGCSIGFSTRCLAGKYPSAKLTGLDLSPYFLSVAQFKENKKGFTSKPIIWIHANGEDTGLPPESFDLVSIAYVLHECPAQAITNIIKESFRLLRRGGTIAITDNSPKSKVLQVTPSSILSLELYLCIIQQKGQIPVEYLPSHVGGYLSGGRTDHHVEREMPPVLFTLMKCTEPFLDEYYLLDLENTMREAGFVNVTTVMTDPRHRTVTATVPAQ